MIGHCERHADWMLFLLPVLVENNAIQAEVSLIVASAAAKSLQSCPTLCNPIGGSPPGSPVTGIFQASTLEWVAISFSNG